MRYQLKSCGKWNLKLFWKTWKFEISYAWLESLTIHDSYQIKQRRIGKHVCLWFESLLTWIKSLTSCQPLTCLIRIRLNTCLKSWTCVTQITSLTWLGSRENGSLLFMRSCFTLLAHLTQITKLCRIKSN